MARRGRPGTSPISSRFRRLGRNIIIESTFEVGGRFRCSADRLRWQPTGQRRTPCLHYWGLPHTRML